MLILSLANSPPLLKRVMVLTLLCPPPLPSAQACPEAGMVREVTETLKLLLEGDGGHCSDTGEGAMLTSPSNLGMQV